MVKDYYRNFCIDGVAWGFFFLSIVGGGHQISITAICCLGRATLLLDEFLFGPAERVGAEQRLRCSS